MQEYIDGNKINAGSGFKGKYLNIRMDGNITDGLSYSFRYRLNKPARDASFFDAVDWVTFKYLKAGWQVSAGKQVVCIGGFEYDWAPIDIYYASEYWNNIACYQFGVSGGYTAREGNDTFLLQFCQSPFRTNALNSGNHELFAYNLMWCGTHGFFTPIYSVNMIEYLPGRFINYIALGNRFTAGQFVMELDFMNRAVDIHDFLAKDFSVMGEIQWHPSDRLNVFARMSYDVNRTDVVGDLCVAPGTDLCRFGGGLEFWPLRNCRNLRLHLNCCYTDGRGVPDTVLKPGQLIWDAGVTWKMTLIDIKRKSLL